mmetsp:Transcript_26665/g.29725  ORF Transcript_26665/g.29725 Transcript_26665/m.29725 type:complete len:175 (+) Transcript_26665:727-1251(+)
MESVCVIDAHVLVLQNAIVTIQSPTVIKGDFTNKGEVILQVEDETATTLTVEGCLEIKQNTSFVIDVSGVDTSSDKVINAISSPCINGIVQVITSDCVDHEQQRSNNGIDLFLIKRKCTRDSNSLAIVLGVMFGFLVLFVVLIIFVFVFGPLRQAIVPWSLRSLRRDVKVVPVN